MTHNITRRDLLRNAAFAAAGIALPFRMHADEADHSDQARLTAWTSTLRREAPKFRGKPFGRRAVRVGELAVGSPYEAFALEAYIKAGGNPEGLEPLALSLSRFDCVTLVESCLAVARVGTGMPRPTWRRFAREVERMRYRGGKREGYVSRLHYFSEWISDGEKRGLVRDLGKELGGVVDPRPLRFMTEHRSLYPALADDNVFGAIRAMEKSLDSHQRYMIPAAGIPDVVDRIESGDVLAFTTSVPGIDVSHAAYAYRGADGVLRVLHAPLSGGAVEITRTTLPEYVSAIRKATGILIARPFFVS
ncbi:MAG TPA: N-acetylmuramoyl-L-alanine amidase-like domain-containing protein [Gemmatimonadaceae bacterium]|nr:N-acetylmuramoyl-L-alanine amidase-like domain-containing protein [Gemmatimonadaceae bacterium]